ncbi:MAG: hypothetical protein LBB08_01955 [Rickettsiales bacterium]|jgi:hypothetical protein|nr:hypothetical protein [Rickettsiales bacterium]
MKKSTCAFLLFFIWIRLAGAWPIVGDNSLRSAWGVSQAVGSWKGADVPGFWINQVRPTWGQNEAGIALVARRIVLHGGEFCTYQVQAEVIDSGHSNNYTTYYLPKGSQCFWLCEPGYAGPECPASSVATCDNKVYAQETFTALELITNSAGAINVEWNLDHFHSQYFRKPDGCARSYECDLDLAVVSYLPNGHGVVAQPINICTPQRSFHGNAYPSAYWLGNRKTLCAQGYQRGANCEAMAACPPANLCSGWSVSATFNADKHQYVVGGGCAKFICKDASTGLPDCNTDCPNGFLQGIQKNFNNADYGKCVNCPVGQYFDPSSGTCKSAVSYSTDDLMKIGSIGAPLDRQCWTKFTPDEYKACIKK